MLTARLMIKKREKKVVEKDKNEDARKNVGNQGQNTNQYGSIMISRL